MLVRLSYIMFAVHIDEYMTLASGRLLIGSVRSRDAGRYRCSGYNDVIDTRVWSPTAYWLRVVDGTLSRLLLWPRLWQKWVKHRSDVCLFVCLFGSILKVTHQWA